MTWVVILEEKPRAVWGPFPAYDEARQFAGFVTSEVGPADVRELCSPATELLSWRAGVALPVMAEQRDQALTSLRDRLTTAPKESSA